MIHLPFPTKLTGNTFCFKMLLYFIYVGKLHSVPNLLVQKCRDDFERNPKPEWRRHNENLLQPCWICILTKQNNASCSQKGQKGPGGYSSLLATCGLITNEHRSMRLSQRHIEGSSDSHHMTHVSQLSSRC